MGEVHLSFLFRENTFSQVSAPLRPVMETLQEHKVGSSAYVPERMKLAAKAHAVGR